MQAEAWRDPGSRNSAFRNLEHKFRDSESALQLKGVLFKFLLSAAPWAFKSLRSTAPSPSPMRPSPSGPDIRQLETALCPEAGNYLDPPILSLPARRCLCISAEAIAETRERLAQDANAERDKKDRTFREVHDRKDFYVGHGSGKTVFPQIQFILFFLLVFQLFPKFLIINLLKPDSVSSSHSSSIKPCSLADEELRSPVGGEAF
ncbi:hypothetical protein AAY473_011542 [Plecturocebus cupreus]